MSIIQGLISFILHIDEHLVEIIQNFGVWSYAILFGIVFTETGVVIFPFLPGDSLLFAAGALAAQDAFSVTLLIIVFLSAAVLGDTLNYHIGKKVGMSISPNSLLGKVINQERMITAQHFFNKHGGKTIVMARFMPFIRTFIPFIAGASRMNYGYFIIYNVIGGTLWVIGFVLLGYFFGNIPVIEKNFSLVIMIIIALSVIPPLYSAMKAKYGKSKEK